MAIDPSERFLKAREAADAGRHQEALDGYVWFHHHALEHEPALYGVRLSFALADWVGLGVRYPKALEELEAIRRDKTARLLAGECDESLFHDVFSINEALGNEGASYELFVALDRQSAEIAAACAHIAMPAIVAAGDHGMARRYLGNLQDAVHQLSLLLNEVVGDFAGLSGERGEDDEEMHEARSQAFAHNHAAALQRILDVAQACGEDVAGLRDQALRSIDDDGIRQAVSQALRG